MRVVAGEFADAAWRTGLIQNKVGHPGSASPGFHSSVTVEHDPARANRINPSAVVYMAERTKPNTICIAVEFPKAADTANASNVYTYYHR